MRLRATLAGLATASLVVGCTSDAADSDEADAPRDAAQVVTSPPDAAFTLVADAEAVASAVATSRALFDSADVTVVARDGDTAGTLLAASAAVGLGVPLLLEPAGGAVAAEVAAELDRLGTVTVLAVGDAAGTASDESAGAGGPEVVQVPADPDAVAAATGLEWTAESVAADGEAAAVAALDPDELVALQGDGATAPASGDGTDAELPAVDRADELSGTVVLAGDGPESLAGIATARAAGARVVLTGEQTDPRASADVVESLSEEQPESVVALGAGFAAEDGLEWKLETAATGTQLPGGGQLLFPGRMLVALYGHPGTGALGVLGEQPLDAAIERARAHAAPYEPLVEATVVPAFEIIATVASSSAGADGDYSAEADPEFLRPWVEAAGEAGLYVVLDLQPGRTDFVTQAELYRSLLELPHVGLALDPEWRLGPGEVHLTQIGSVEIDEVNRVITWLADLTRENALPQKLLVLHQFRLDMLPGRERVDTSRDELAVMIHADGQGGQGDKQATWRALQETAPPGLYWGWKNFYDEDLPMLTPEQTIGQVSPVPELVTYQ
ncbi:hypothetical protein FHU33_3416 [Blastococcus colisei]|uniref:Cell wall binding repeat protein n=1 Tax=Blastococcus colisei TaxID=1564162 RepID=A0A543PIN9_9ACTN|nr:hypothetical protein [Blastococcus colisei]TQN43941.1 hypothetical protein FHU33_3416 [Blastococcus colisei]